MKNYTNRTEYHREYYRQRRKTSNYDKQVNFRLPLQLTTRIEDLAKDMQLSKKDAYIFVLEKGLSNLDS